MQTESGPRPETLEEIERLHKLAEYLISGQNPQRLLELGQKSLELARQVSSVKDEAQSLSYVGIAHWFMGESRAGRKALAEAKALFEEIGDEAGATKALVGLLSLEKSFGTYDQSLAHSYACLKFFRESGDRVWEAISLLSLATLLYDVGDVQKAIEYYEETVHIGEKILPDWVFARAYVGMGACYQAQREYGKALYYYVESLHIFEASHNVMGKARVLHDMGIINHLIGQNESALEYHLKSLEIRRRIGQRDAESTSLISLGKLYTHLGDVSRALASLREGLAIASEVQSKLKIYQAHQALSEAYELEGNLAEALKHQRRFQELREEIFSNEANAQLKNLQTRFELERSEREAEIARLKNVELRKKNEQLQQLLEDLQTAQSQLIHSEKMASLGKLVAGIAHELNSPLGAVKGANQVTSRCLERLEEVLKEGGSLVEAARSERFREALKLIADDSEVIQMATERMASLIKSLKSFARLDQSEYQKTDIRKGIDSVLDLLGSKLRERVSIVKEYEEIPDIQCYPGDLNQVFMTLLTNAAEAIDGPGSIRIAVSMRDGNVRIEISDSGRGIPPERLARLFDFDFSESGSRIKMAAGLIAARNVVQKHGGTIKVESEQSKGSTFAIEIPAESRASRGR